VLEAARGAEVLVHEATFLEDERERAQETGHATALDAAELARAREGEERLFRSVVALGGSISGEHGIGYRKARYLGLELSPATIALMKRVKRAFDPSGVLNPGKIFPPDDRG